MDDKTLEREIEDLLAVDPAPEFRARLRQRIASEPPLGAPNPAWRLSWIAAGVALVAAAITLAVIARDVAPPRAEMLLGQPIEAVSYTAPQVPTISSGVPRGLATRETPRASRTGVDASDEVLVDPSEVAAWHRLLGDIGAGRAEIPVVHASRESSQPLPEGYVVPLVIIEPLNPDVQIEGVHQ